MAHVLVYNNFLKPGQDSILASRGGIHKYTCISPGFLQANPFAKTKHINALDLARRLMSAFLVSLKATTYDVLIVDSAINGILISCFLYFCRNPRIIVASFNVPRRRGQWWTRTFSVMLRRVHTVIVHSRLDCDLVNRLYKLRAVFLPFVREEPAQGMPVLPFAPTDPRPYILSFGGNSRDYATLLKAVDGTRLNTVIVAREYNLRGLCPPPNVQVFTNIPLAECDKLVRGAQLCVFTFDGREPSCGQISIVTALMCGKPVICTDCQGVQDYVADDLNGRLVRLGDADDLRRTILEVMGTPSLYDRLVRGALEWRDQNTRPACVQAAIEGIVAQVHNGGTPAAKWPLMKAPASTSIV